MHSKRHTAARIGCGLAFLIGCGARTTLNPGELASFGAAGARSSAGAAGAPASPVAGAGAGPSSGGASVGGASVGGAGGSIVAAGFGGSAAGEAGSGPCTDVGCICLDPRLLLVTPPNARNGALGAAGVKATFSCTPHPSISRPAAMTVTGQFAGALPASFPTPAQPNDVLLMPAAPDGVRKDPYFAGEWLTARLSMPLGGPYLWQFMAAVRAKTAVSFSDTGQALAPAMSAALADLDHDGDLDLVTGSSSDMFLRVYANDGTGTFSLRATVPGVGEPFLADLDGDGAIDIASDHVFLNAGGFGFTDGVELGEVHAVFDADADGDFDIFQVQDKQQWALLQNDGKGTFAPVLMDQAYVFDAKAGDLDNDGDLDLVLIALVEGSGTPDVYRGAVLLNDGSGHFVEIDSGLEVDATRALALGDVDGDGDLDVFMGSWGAAGARNPADQVWLNDGQARFRAGDAPLSGSPHVLLADLDGDGDLDAIAGQHSPYSTAKGEPSQVLLNDGQGRFRAAGVVGGSNFQHVVLGDLDGDGDLDAVVTEWDWTDKPPVQIWLNDN